MLVRLRVNGVATTQVDALDRGFGYGDGLLESIRLVGTVAPLWPRHMRRLLEGCARLRIPVPDPAQTSLPRKAPCGAWAERLLGGLIDLHLIEVDHSILVGITARVAMLLQQFGDDAQDSGEIAQKLTKELERVRGVGALFATAGDLQIALRRTQDPPTQPVEMPFR